MINFLQTFKINSYDTLVSKIETSQLQHLPLHAYWKDKKGTYLGNNDYMAHDAGYHHAAEMYGTTDHQLSWANEADVIRKNDESILFYEKPRIFIELGTLANGNKAKSFSYKLPLHTRSKKLVGILGLSFIIPDDQLFLLMQDNYSFLQEPINLKHLTTRQKECVYWLARGYNIKQIARTLKISPRTVEHYLETIKDKLNCSTRAELIEKISPKIKM